MTDRERPPAWIARLDAGDDATPLTLSGPPRRALEDAGSQVPSTAPPESGRWRFVREIGARGGHVALPRETAVASAVRQPLARLLAARGPLAPGEAVTLVAPLAETLAIAHERGWAHGGVAPDAVELDASGRPLLAAWGRSRPDDGGVRLDDLRGLAGVLRLALGDAGDLSDDVTATLRRLETRDAASLTALEFADALYAWCEPEPIDLEPGMRAGRPDAQRVAPPSGAVTTGERRRLTVGTGLGTAGLLGRRGRHGAARTAARSDAGTSRAIGVEAGAESDRPRRSARRKAAALVVLTASLVGAIGVLALGSGDEPESPGGVATASVPETIGAASPVDSNEHAPSAAPPSGAAPASEGDAPPRETPVSPSSPPPGARPSGEDPVAAAVALLDTRATCFAGNDPACLDDLYGGDGPGLEVDLARLGYADATEATGATDPTDCRLVDRSGAVALVECPLGDHRVAVTIEFVAGEWRLRDVRDADDTTDVTGGTASAPPSG